jgi:putative copper resistance protein D
MVGLLIILFTTGFGQALTLKLALVAGLLGLATINKLRFIPRLRSGDPNAAYHLAELRTPNE